MREFLSAKCRNAVALTLSEADRIRRSGSGSLTETQVDDLLLKLGAPALDLPLYLLAYMQFVAPAVVPADATSVPALPLNLHLAGNEKLPAGKMPDTGTGDAIVSEAGAAETVDMAALDDDDEVHEADQKKEMEEVDAGAVEAQDQDPVIGRTLKGKTYLRIGAWPWYTGSQDVGDVSVIVPNLPDVRALDPIASQVEIVNTSEYNALIRHYPFPSVL